MEQKAVPAESIDQTLNGGVGDIELARDLAMARAGNLGTEDGFEEVGAPQPIGGGEGL